MTTFRSCGFTALGAAIARCVRSSSAPTCLVSPTSGGAVTIEANDWSLTPGRYVGIAPEEDDEDFDFTTAMREIHAELAELNAEAAVLAARIQENFGKLRI